MKIEHSTILITSAGNTMGRAISCHFAALGAHLIIADSNLSDLDKTHQICSELGTDVVSYQLKDESTDSIRHLFHAIDEEFGSGIDVLINNYIDVTLPSLFDTQTNDSPLLLTKLASTLFNYGQFAAQNMRKHKKEGVIINLGHHQNVNQPCSLDNSKALLTGLTKRWAKELNPFNIRVGGVTPRLFNKVSAHTVNLINQELIKNTEYIVENDYFNGRILEATA
ncbi:SDR family oxidoreductase [Aliivibrio salmonicida]|uniref:Short chain dehydrogenase n=1 Tax=Aliivibrio salmonicida (strain LFI1238) TaxID=316275 RepID=B6ENP7_ALISL|nr:SDR family oxidoreductase [Aliivibrio salmonicida]AZL85062.1 SDR family oxidoreductase [Aliivibrio salmonicida]CAQ79541.1 hypothetical protein VSAL_I1856 [Aliivibrio salmonicida LFI1238]